MDRSPDFGQVCEWLVAWVVRAREAARVGMRRVRCLRGSVERGGSRDDMIVTVGGGGRTT